MPNSGGPTKRPGRQPPWGEKSEPPETGSFGQWLRRQREMREISLRDIAERTKISLRYLEAMEEDRFDVLPAPIFAKGFLREYARYVGLSPDEVVNHYLAVQQPEELEGERTGTEIRVRRDRDKGRRRSWTWGLFLLLAGVALLALVGLFAYYGEKRQQESSTTQPPPPIAAPPETAAPKVVPPAPPPTPSSPLQVTLDFTQNCWVEAVVDGKNVLSELRVQGESVQLEARESVLLKKLGNAGGVSIQVNGYPLPLDAGPGQVVNDLMIDLATAQALKEKREAR